MKNYTLLPTFFFRIEANINVWQEKLCDIFLCVHVWCMDMLMFKFNKTDNRDMHPPLLHGCLLPNWKTSQSMWPSHALYAYFAVQDCSPDFPLANRFSRSLLKALSQRAENSLHHCVWTVQRADPRAHQKLTVPLRCTKDIKLDIYLVLSGMGQEGRQSGTDSERRQRKGLP